MIKWNKWSSWRWRRPRETPHWSVRLRADRVGLAPATIHRIWRLFGLQPHRSKSFRLSNDPLFVAPAGAPT
jgi:hypothetical protein